MVNCVKGINIEAISCAVPARKLSIQEYAPDLLTEKSAKRMAKGTGFSSLRISDDDTTTADLVVAAAEPLLDDFGRENIGALIFVSQTPNYVLPATSHILQAKLGLPNNIFCVDINEGCSGYVTGLYTAGMLAKQINKSVCLLGGDTISKITSPTDRATRCIFGDAGTATIVSPGKQDVNFVFASYGDRSNAIIMENSRHRKVKNPINDGYLYLDGIGIMNFTLNEVPDAIDELLKANDLARKEISLYACHQANKVILTSLADKLGVSQDKIPFTAGEIGNESSASIPLVLTASQQSDLSNTLCCGFGVGLSVGACIYDFSGTKFYGVKEI